VHAHEHTSVLELLLLLIVLLLLLLLLLVMVLMLSEGRRLLHWLAHVGSLSWCEYKDSSCAFPQAV
jgi:hypothetical protein